MLSRMVDRVFTAWEYSFEFFPKRAVMRVTGNPVRSKLFESTRSEAKSYFGLGEKFTLLVLGGSRGARTLVETAVKMGLYGNLDIQMLLITGHEYYNEAVRILGAEKQTGIAGAKTGNIILRPYVYNMEMAYQACDVVLGRAGGMTLAEITALGLPSIIVPSPNVVGNHQEYNARALEEAGAAVVIREGPGVPESIHDSLNQIVSDSELYKNMANASRQIGRPNAARHIARELITLARHK